MSEYDIQQEELVAELIAADMLSDIAMKVEFMLASGANPKPPAQQKIATARIAEVRKRLAEGKVRPWFAHFLNTTEKLDRWHDEDLRGEDIRRALASPENLDGVRTYAEQMAALEAKQ